MGFKPSLFRKGTRSHTNNNYNRQGSTNNNGVKGFRTSSGGWNNSSKEIKCWGCNRSHFYRNFPHSPNKKISSIKMLQEASTVNDLARNIPRINVALEDQQEDH